MKNALSTFLLGILITLTSISCTQSENKNNTVTPVDQWKLVYKNDKDGNKVLGDKKELLSSIRQGAPIRIGWSSRRRNDSTKTVEHILDAEFMTIANGEDVFAQVKPFLAQRPDLTSDTLSITIRPTHVYWTLGTNGLISSANVDYTKDTVTTSPPSTFRYNISWFTKNVNSSKNTPPLWNQK